MFTPSEYLKQLPENTSSRKIYRAALKRYLEIITGTQINSAELDSAWTVYFSHHPNTDKDLMLFLQLAQTRYHFAPKTILLYRQIVLQYLREAGIVISQKMMHQLRLHSPKNQAVSKEFELDYDSIHILLTSAPLRLKTELLILISSGMRIGELLSITCDDIRNVHNLTAIFIRAEYTKTKMSRTVFISSEAADALCEWLKVRASKLCGKMKPGENRIFPYTVSNEIYALRGLLIRCGLFEKDKVTRRSTIHFHLFRKFFLTEFKLAASSEVAEELAGHKGYLSDSYRRLSQKTLREEYLKAEPRLSFGAGSVHRQNRMNYGAEGWIKYGGGFMPDFGLVQVVLVPVFLYVQR